MTTRTRYKRGSGSAYGYGGAWLRSWFGAAPPAASPGTGGNSAQEFRGAQAVTAATPDPYSMLKGALTMGGSVIGRSADGKITYVSIGGMVVPFNTATGTQAGPPTPGSATGATPTGGGTATGGAAGPSGGTGVATGGGSSRVGQKVTAQTANGVVSGTITAEANGQTTVTWDDGTVANYGADGKLVSSTPPTGAAGGTGADGTVVPGDGGDTTQPPAAPAPVVAPGGVATDEGQITSGAVPGYTPPAPVAPPAAPAVAPGGVATDEGQITSGAVPGYTPPPVAPPPVVAPGGVATDEGQITSGAVPGYTPPEPAPAPYAPPPAAPYVPPAGVATDEGQLTSGAQTYSTPPPPAPVVDPYAGMISTPYGWMTVDQLQAMFGPTTAPTYAPPPTPPPAPPPAPSPYQPPPGVATDEGQYTSGSYGYVPPPPPPSPYDGYGSGMY